MRWRTAKTNWTHAPDGNCFGQAARSGKIEAPLLSQPRSALAGLEPTVRLIDHIDTSFAPDDTIVAMPGAQRLERIADFHGTVS
jgi:hypothetical protein